MQQCIQLTGTNWSCGLATNFSRTLYGRLICVYILFYIFLSFFGGHGKEETPVPIPNTEVKLFSADGTARETARESRSLPKNFSKTRD